MVGKSARLESVLRALVLENQSTVSGDVWGDGQLSIKELEDGSVCCCICVFALVRRHYTTAETLFVFEIGIRRAGGGGQWCVCSCIISQSDF